MAITIANVRAVGVRTGDAIGEAAYIMSAGM
jgi:hypothetical protein